MFTRPEACSKLALRTAAIDLYNGKCDMADGFSQQKHLGETLCEMHSAHVFTVMVVGGAA